MDPFAPTEPFDADPLRLELDPTFELEPAADIPWPTTPRPAELVLLLDELLPVPPMLPELPTLLVLPTLPELPPGDAFALPVPVCDDVIAACPVDALAEPVPEFDEPFVEEPVFELLPLDAFPLDDVVLLEAFDAVPVCDDVPFDTPLPVPAGSPDEPPPAVMFEPCVPVVPLPLESPATPLLPPEDDPLVCPEPLPAAALLLPALPCAPPARVPIRKPAPPASDIASANATITTIGRRFGAR